MLITARSIAKALRDVEESGGARTMTDQGPKGEGRLALVVRKRGAEVSASWFAVFFLDGIKTRRRIGGYPALSLADARSRFRDDYVPAIKAGRDPAAAKPGKAAASIDPASYSGASVGDLFTAYVVDLRRKGKRSWPDAERILRSAANAIGKDKPAADVTRGDLIPYLQQIYQRGAPVAASAARKYAAAAFSWALKASGSYTHADAEDRWKLTAGNPILAIGVDTEAVRPGERWLTPMELAQLWAWLVPYQRLSFAASAVLLKIATGQRSEEILRLARVGSEGVGFFDKAAGTVFWSKTKSGASHLLPLPRQAREILAVLEPVTAMRNPRGLFFPNQRNIGRPAASQSMWRVVGKYLETNPEIKKFDPRALRRTWKTLAGVAGISKDDRDRLQNHRAQDVSTKFYDRYDGLPEARAAMRTWEEFLDRIIAGEDVTAEDDAPEVITETMEVPDWMRGDYRPPTTAK